VDCFLTRDLYTLKAAHEWSTSIAARWEWWRWLSLAKAEGWARLKAKGTTQRLSA